MGKIDSAQGDLHATLRSVHYMVPDLLWAGFHPDQGDRRCSSACTELGASLAKNLQRLSLWNGASLRLEKRFVQLARKSASRRRRESSDTTSRSRDLRWDTKTDRQADTHTE